MTETLPHCSCCIPSLWLSASAVGLAWLHACQSARVFAEFSIPNPADIDVILFCKGLGVEMAFLGALSVHKVELLELVGQPALERYKRNPSFRGCFAPLRQPQSNKAAARFGKCGYPNGMFINAATWPGVLLPSSITLTTRTRLRPRLICFGSAKFALF